MGNEVIPKPGEVVAPVSAPVEPVASTTTTPEPASSPKTYSSEEYSKVETTLKEYERMVANANQFFSTDKDSKERLDAWIKSQNEGVPYEKLVADLVASKSAPTKGSKTEPENLTMAQVEQLVQQRLEGGMGNVRQELSTIQAE